MASPGDVVAVESPTYYGLLQVVESLQMQALEIPCSPRTGLSIEALELALQTQPRLKAVVVVPELQMPLGTRIPDEHKARLVDLCGAHGVALIEDDSYGLFVESSQPVRPIKAWDRLPGHVIYCEAFNKSMAPGLRQGWMNAGQWHGRVQMLKFARSRGTQTLAQLLAAACVGSPAHLRNLQRLKQQLRRQREGMAQLVARFFPAGHAAEPAARRTQPVAGVSGWRVHVRAVHAGAGARHPHGAGQHVLELGALRALHAPGLHPAGGCRDRAGLPRAGCHGLCAAGSAGAQWVTREKRTQNGHKADAKKPPGLRRAVFCRYREQAELLQLDFLVRDVLASLGIKLHDRHLLGHCLLVLGRGVEVAGSCSGFQLDLFASAFSSHGVSP